MLTNTCRMSEKAIILYVDDELINLKVFEINLSKKYFVLTAESGMKGLELLSNKSDIKIVISDMRMPDMNGLEFIKSAKEQYSQISCFLFTGYEITNEIEEALKNRLILRYFKKPLNMQKVSSAIEKAISES